ncbi:MAG TPA: VWA domain-containing protein [Candidatus Acidoferrum sp.]|nr:VWA domain-containing protein [Candidatus Acidoferrum sp.]
MHFSKKACRVNLRQAFLFIFLVFPKLASAQETQTPAIRVAVSRVNVGVVATDRHGNFVEGLQKSDFHIFDNGVEQPIAGFLANDDPAQVVLMLECGPAMRLFGRENLQKADALIANLAPQDRVSIVCYSSGPHVMFDLSPDLTAARTFLREMNFSSGLGDLNLSESLLVVLDRLNSVPGKKTIVLIGSGVDGAPPENAEMFQSRISASEVQVLIVSTSLPFKKLPKKHKHDLDERDARAKVAQMFKEADARLRSLAAATGGHVYFPKAVKDYQKIYVEIAQIVRHEYNLAFVPQSSDGKLHSLTVTASHTHRLDHRQAYLAPAATP